MEAFHETILHRLARCDLVPFGLVLGGSLQDRSEALECDVVRKVQHTDNSIGAVHIGLRLDQDSDPCANALAACLRFRTVNPSSR